MNSSELEEFGTDRIGLIPFTTTETHGRKKFFIHGGKEAGSGCGIDLTNKMKGFVDEFVRKGKDLVLIVRIMNKELQITDNNIIFPLPLKPYSNFTEPPRSFGCSRMDRKHAGCDLYAAEGTEVLAVKKGTIIEGPYPFYKGTVAIEIDHGDFIARYTEMKNTIIKGVKKGSTVVAGQIIGYVEKMPGVDNCMLHFEMYSGNEKGPLTVRNNLPYKRRSDLIDPTDFLKTAYLKKIKAEA